MRCHPYTGLSEYMLLRVRGYHCKKWNIVWGTVMSPEGLLLRLGKRTRGRTKPIFEQTGFKGRNHGVRIVNLRS